MIGVRHRNSRSIAWRAWRSGVRSRLDDQDGRLDRRVASSGASARPSTGGPSTTTWSKRFERIVAAAARSASARRATRPGLGGIGPAVRIDRFGRAAPAIVGQLAVAGQEVAEAELVFRLEDLVDRRVAHIGVDQQDLRADLGEARARAPARSSTCLRWAWALVSRVTGACRAASRIAATVRIEK